MPRPAKMTAIRRPLRLKIVLLTLQMDCVLLVGELRRRVLWYHAEGEREEEYADKG